jgi:hypothetical protein
LCITGKARLGLRFGGVADDRNPVTWAKLKSGQAGSGYDKVGWPGHVFAHIDQKQDVDRVVRVCNGEAGNEEQTKAHSQKESEP